MPRTAAIVLAGGRSTRMGCPKAALDWHGSTLLRRVVGLVARAVDGPVVVVGAPGQALPPLPAGVELATDAREGRGPLQGLASGLAAVGDRAEVAFVSCTDAPLLHPAFVAAVTGALDGGFEAAVPDVGGHRQPLAAAYRPSLHVLIDELIAAGRLATRFLFERCRVRALDERELLADARLARVDPQLSSVVSLNDRAAYERALALPAPAVRVRLLGPFATALPPELRARTVRAWSLGELATAAGVALGEGVLATLDGDRVGHDPELPLVAGDAISLSAGDGVG